MEHDIAEIKGGFGFDVIACRDYQGNGAHQQISTLVYNLVRNFQLDVMNPTSRPKTSSQTNLFKFTSLKSLQRESSQTQPINNAPEILRKNSEPT